MKLNKWLTISCLALYVSVVTPSIASLIGPVGATSFHLELTQPIVPGGGGYGSSPFGHPKYDPNGPPSVSIDYSGPALTSETEFKFDPDSKFKFIFTDAPKQGDLVVIKYWWDINDVPIHVYDFTNSSTKPTLSAIPIPAAIWLFGSALITGVYAIRRRNKF